jgi:hypothetical protein
MERLTFDWVIIPTSDRSDGASTTVASGPRAPAPAAMHDGTRTNRISATGNEGLDQSRCNSPAGNTKIFWKSLLGADPRAPWKWSKRPYAVDEPAADTGDSGSGGRPWLAPWPDTAAGHARPANAEPPAGRPHCNIVPGDDPAGTASRIPSTGTTDGEDDAGQGLEPCPIPGHAEAGPRERRTPKRSSRGAERLFRSATPFTLQLRLLHSRSITPTRNHLNRHQPIAFWLPWFRENGSLLRRHRHWKAVY